MARPGEALIQNSTGMPRRGGKAVLLANPRLLIMVESPEYSTNFTDFDKLPVALPVAHRLVYSPHTYYFKGQDLSNFDARLGGFSTKPIILSGYIGVYWYESSAIYLTQAYASPASIHLR